MLPLVAALLLTPADTVVTILHTNDLHAHPEPVMMGGMPYGGYDRQASLIRKFRLQDPNVLLLNAGDTFQGTLYFNAFDGLSDLAYLNVIGYQAACLGNHEFDEGPGPLGVFAAHANFPILAANVDASGEPRLKGLISASAVIKAGPLVVGVVGAVTPDVPSISSPGPTIKFKDLRTSVQAAVDDLSRRGIDKIILITHIGYNQDQELAKQLRGVDVIVGGHSHTPLGTPALRGWPTPDGPYPTFATTADGQRVPIVQAYEWGKVLGRLKVHFDAKGHVTRVTEAGPIVVDEEVPVDPVVGSMLAAFKKPIEAMANEKIGTAAMEISRSGLMPNIVADALLQATTEFKTDAAFVNAGGVRAGLDAGAITYGELVSVLPFGNSTIVQELTGAELKQVLEEGVPQPDKLGGLLFPSAGTSYRVDFTQPLGSRITNLIVAGRPLDPQRTYTIAVNAFTAKGGDAHLVLQNLTGKRTDTGIVDLETLISYVKKHSPLNPKNETRVVR